MADCCFDHMIDKYEFRLYAGTEHATVLVKTKVSRSK